MLCGNSVHGNVGCVCCRMDIFRNIGVVTKPETRIISFWNNFATCMQLFYPSLGYLINS
jgi:hypothetical protein